MALISRFNIIATALLPTYTPAFRAHRSHPRAQDMVPRVSDRPPDFYLTLGVICSLAGQQIASKFMHKYRAT